MDYICIACCLVSTLLYYNTLDIGFVYDDRRAILSNQDILPSTPLHRLLVNDFWGTPLSHSGSHGSYRPLVVLSFRLNYLVDGFKAQHFHLVNILLHCMATSLVVRLARNFIPSPLPTLITGLLFAAHPIHTEAVAGIVGRADIASCIFFIISFLCYISHVQYRDARKQRRKISVNCIARVENFSKNGNSHQNGGRYLKNDEHLRVCDSHGRCNGFGLAKNQYICENGGFLRSWQPWVCLFGCILFAVCALLCKEIGITVLPLCIVYDLILHCNKLRHLLTNFYKIPRKLIASLAILSTALCLLLMLRLHLLQHSVPTFSTADNPTARSPSFITRTLTFLYLPSFNFLLLLFPNQLSFDWSMDAIPRISSVTDPRNLITSVFYWAIYSITKSSIRRLLYPIQKSTLVIRKTTKRRQKRVCLSERLLEQLAERPPVRVTQLFQSKMERYEEMVQPGKLVEMKVVDLKRVDLHEPCPVCQHKLVDHHSVLCRNTNNNNTISAVGSKAPCHCTLEMRSAEETEDGGEFLYECNGSQHVSQNNELSVLTIITKYAKDNSRNLLDLSKDCFLRFCVRVRSFTRKDVFEDDDDTSRCSHESNNSRKSSTMPKIQTKCIETSRFRKPPDSSQVLLLSIAFLAVPFLPATNLFFHVGFVVAERVLYIPSVGYCLLVGLGCHLLAKYISRRLVYVGCAILLTTFAARTIQRNRDWMDEESLYRSGISINPPKSYANLGSVLSSQGRLAEAEWAFKMALKHRSNMADAHYNLGILLERQGQLNEAVQYYQRAIQYRPSLALAYVQLGRLFERRGRPEEAVSLYRKCSKIDSAGLKDPHTHELSRMSAMLNLGRLYTGQGRNRQAVEIYQEAVEKMPDDYPPQALYALLGEAHSRLKQHGEAERWCRLALRAQPDHVAALLTYGNTLARNKSRIGEAERWFRRAKELAPTDPSVYQHFGQFLTNLERHSEAAVLHVKAAELSPAEPELVLSAAMALRQAGHRQKAEDFYRLAAQLRPKEARSHLNLGAILHLNGKYTEASACYHEALRLQPGDPTALTNLHKLHSTLARLQNS